MKKIAFITAWLVENQEAFEGKTNADIEKEIVAEVGSVPYVAYIEKVTVLDVLSPLHSLSAEPESNS